MTPRRWLYNLRRHLREESEARRAVVAEDPAFVLGTQKSGTSAIAALLGLRCGLETTLDLRRELRRPSVHEVRSGRRPFDAFVNHNAVDFSRPLIKEPNLTFVLDDLLKRWPTSRLVFVVRDPVQTIRSVLDRLDLPGDAPQLTGEQLATVPKAWRIVLNNEWIGVHDAHYIEQLAGRWRVAAELARKMKDRVITVRYEDFLADKSGVIDRLAEGLGLSASQDIQARLDEPFQPRGRRREQPDSIFGVNLKRIHARTAEMAASFGYQS
ncbi:MAG: sulfotransferase [Phycisphaerales bacterium]|nr:sulfotransferase [Phycisphaerales bacterium]